jgi:putative addiction module killer protein
MEPKRRSVDEYLKSDGSSPFEGWLKTVSGDARGRIRKRLRRIDTNGNYGDCEPVGEGVFELRFIGKGPGYRVYFGIDGDGVILLNGGAKGTQESDIKRAKAYWSDYNA